VPALIVSGDKDTVCKPEASDRMHRDIPGANLTCLAPAKHMGLIEHHTRFAEIVKTFSSSTHRTLGMDPNTQSPMFQSNRHE
jgi:pimeloyl-ACP methyl ester carboxylesterase